MSVLASLPPMATVAQTRAAMNEAGWPYRSDGAIYARIDAGEIRAVRLGRHLRVPRSEVERLCGLDLIDVPETADASRLEEASVEVPGEGLSYADHISR